MIKILIVFLLVGSVVGVGYGVKVRRIDKQKSSVRGAISSSNSAQVKGENGRSTKDFSFQQKLEVVIKEVLHLELDDIASSSPQIQRVLGEIKALGKYPRNQAKDLCQKICSGL